jgi:hypothetical protein
VKWILVAVIVAIATPARAEDCVGGTAKPFATCFDPGNRLVIDLAASDASEGAATPTGAIGGGLFLRHIVRTGDPEVTWRVEHGIFAGAIDLAPAGRYQATVYHAQFLRHARDGHIVLPFAPAKKVFFPFDLGLESTVLSISGLRGDDHVRANMVRASAFLELLRSPDFTRRLEIGPVVRWDADVDRTRRTIDEHQVAPFSLASISLHLESKDGIAVLDTGVEGGMTWSNLHGWRATAGVRFDVERVLVALDDRPLALFADAAWSPSEDGGAHALIGLRLAVFGRNRRPASALRR